MLFNLANIPYWIFLGVGVLLFVFVIASGGGDDDLDTDIDADIDADIDVEADLDSSLDMDMETDGEFSAGQMLAWFGLGRAPLMLLLALDLSLWGLLGWVLNVVIGETIGSIPQGLLGILILLGSGLVAINIGGVIARPIGHIFASFGEDASDDRLVGCTGTVTSAFVPFEQSGKIGQVDVFDPARNRITVSATIPNWATITVRRGAKIMVIERIQGHYVVIAQDSPDQQRWLKGEG